MLSSVPAGVYAALVTLAAIGSATVAVWHRSIDGQTYAAIVSGALGLGAGAGIHAAGTQQATNATVAATAAAVEARPAALSGATTSALEAELTRRGTK